MRNDMAEEKKTTLEEAAEKHIQKVRDAAGHPGWEWETQDVSDAFIAGAEWQKAKMLKDAVKGYITLTLTGQPTIATPLNDKEFTPNDKVKIIIVKEE